MEQEICMKELLKKLLKFVEENSTETLCKKLREGETSGLCVVPIRMLVAGIISIEEESSLRNYIRSKKPKRGKHFDERWKKTPWFWPPYLAIPRIFFLKDLIKRTPKSVLV